ncbi:armadillo-type protein [Tricladium varicosporioides]|nr:armadillo-type protein [Hymenoscyphus varicosporioides]
MTRQSWILNARNAHTPSDQISFLRALKNEIVGHPGKKELVVSQGILEPVIRLTANKTGTRYDGKSHDHSFASRPLGEEETVRLQGLQVIASIALGGPSFLPSLHVVSALPVILSNLCPVNNPSQLVLASLRALSNLTDSSALSSNLYPLNIVAIAEALFSRQHLSSLSRIISQSSSTSNHQCQISIAASLIARICREERHQQSLANSGVLDALATKLAGFVVAAGVVIPGADILARRDGLDEYFPKATSSNVGLSVILEAISVIIANSKFRASQLLYSPAILAIFPSQQPTDFINSQIAREAWKAFNVAGLSARQNQLNAVDYLLPFVPYQQPKPASSQASAFPPLGTSGSRDNLPAAGRSISNRYNGASLPNWSDSPGLEPGLANQETSGSTPDEPESPLVAYLIFALRNHNGMERLMAASVLTVLYRAGLTNKDREMAIGLLVVPLLVQMLDGSMPPLHSNDVLANQELQTLEWAVKERAPAVLAMLITDSEYLQKSAFDAGVTGKLASMLKIAYDPVVETASPHSWSPKDQGMEADPQSPKISHHGQPPLLAHKIKVRESTLKAIAALAPFKDEYRKAIVEQGTIPYIVESLNPNPGKPSPKIVDKSEKATNGTGTPDIPQGYGINTVNVMIAAAGAIRALSRSVGILRTTLIDNGVAEPVFRLLQHPDIEVQIASTATVCNLVTDVSPMREQISEMGVLRILCEHARATNAKLRLNALWALKHFVNSVSNEMKRQCLDELGQGWLVQLICDDTEDEALLSSKAKIEGRSNTNLTGEMDEDVEMDQFEEQITPGLSASFNRPNNSRPSSSRSKCFQQAEVRLAALREAEMDPKIKARKDDIAVQEQGLDFIRNLIGGAGQGGTPETTEMIDFLFDALGQDRVFEILASKLRPKVNNPFLRGGSSSQETTIVPPQSEIITAVGYILVHMAASIPRHRQLVIAQTELLKLLVPQFNHTNIEVRLALCWLVTNLTWMDDASDAQACANRASALKNLGFLNKLEMLEHDAELNVRERAKSALWQMKQGY